MDRLLHGATARPSSYRSGSYMAVDTLEDAEPEWGNDANIVRAPKAAAGTSQVQPSASSLTRRHRALTHHVTGSTNGLVGVTPRTRG